MLCSSLQASPVELDGADSLQAEPSPSSVVPVPPECPSPGVCAATLIPAPALPHLWARVEAHRVAGIL